MVINPGGKTIGGPSRSVLKAGEKKDLLTFIRSGPDPFIFICTTGVNSGSGEVSLHYRTRVGGIKTSTYLPGDSSVACGEATAISIECHSGPHSQCTFSLENRCDSLRNINGERNEVGVLAPVCSHEGRDHFTMF